VSPASVVRTALRASSDGAETLPSVSRFLVDDLGLDAVTPVCAVDATDCAVRADPSDCRSSGSGNPRTYLHVELHILDTECNMPLSTTRERFQYERARPGDRQRSEIFTGRCLWPARRTDDRNQVVSGAGRI